MSFRKNVCVCVSVCRRTHSLNQLTDLVQNRYLWSSRKYLEPFFSFPPPLKLRVVHIRKKLKTLIFSKMAPTIFIKFCGSIVYSKPNNMVLSAFPGKSLKLKNILNFFSSPNIGPEPTDQSRLNSIYRILLQIFLAIIFCFLPTLKIKGSSHKKKL